MSGERPFVTLNAAMTADGKIDTVARRGAGISSQRDWERVDRLRAASDAVMVGGRTLLDNDPRLTVKSPVLRAERLALGLEENPAKVGIISRVVEPGAGPTLGEESRFVTAGPARRILFTTAQTHPGQLARVRDLGVELFVMGGRTVDLPAALSCLRQLGIKRVMVEGGATLNAELLRLGLVDEIYLYVAPLIFGGATAPTIVGGEGFDREDAIRLKLLGLEGMDEGAVILHYQIAEEER